MVKVRDKQTGSDQIRNHSNLWPRFIMNSFFLVSENITYVNFKISWFCLQDLYFLIYPETQDQKEMLFYISSALTKISSSFTRYCYVKPGKIK